MTAMGTDADGDAQYRELLDTAPDAMVVVGGDGAITFVNVQTERLFGYPRAELLGEPLDLLVPERFRDDHKHHVGRFLANPLARPMGSGLELFGRRKDGTDFPIEVSLSPLRQGDRVSVSATIRDITARKRIADELREARFAAEAASAAKTEFLSSMSHELRTPLNAILGFAQLLQRDRKEPLSTRHRERVDQILRGGEHLLRLIDEILDLSRIEAGAVAISMEPVDVVEVLKEVRATLEPMAARLGVRLAVDGAPAVAAHVNADRTRLAQIVLNFGSNAIKYNREGGDVTVATSAPTAGIVRITVSDTGHGIPIERQDKLFQPFQRAGQEAGPIEGTGIGLVITKRLAELMGGRVGFRSTPGAGSEFWVELPELAAVVDAPDGPHAKRSAGDRLMSGKRRVVVYVEDNPANVVFLRDVLGDFEDVELLTAPTAEMGIEIIRVRVPDAVIMDINLPGMSGVEALYALRRDPVTKDVPVIALTAAASERDRQRGIQAGFYRYLTKPVKVDELVSALEALLP